MAFMAQNIGTVLALALCIGTLYWHWPLRGGMVDLTARPPSREEVEIALNEAMGRLGPKGLDKFGVAQPFLARGLSKSTCYRWIREILATGRPAAKIEAKVIEAARARAERAPDPAKDAAEAVMALIPPAATLGDLTGGKGTIAVIERIVAILADMDLLVNHAKTEDGRCATPGSSLPHRAKYEERWKLP